MTTYVARFPHPDTPTVNWVRCIPPQRGFWMTGWMVVKTGELLTFIRKAGAGLQVDVNGAVKGTIKGDDFAKAFLLIWLGADPPNPEIKAGMLGGPCG
jgi:hypothetical protein